MKTVLEMIGMKEAKGWKSKFTPKECSNPEQLVGLEIETENCGRDASWYVQHLSKLWDTKTDGSLRGNAFEFISRPATIGTTLAELEEFYKLTQFAEYNYTDRCSIHVHTNVQDMNPHQIATLCLVYAVIEEVLFEFINFYKVADPRGKYRDTNIYCVPWSQCRMNYQIVSKMFDDLEYSFRNWQKYTALNLIPVKTLGTVEWRHLHGSADMEKISIWLNVIGSILRYSKTKSFEEVVETIKSLNDNSAYRQFYNDVLGGWIPYEDKYAVAISIGVVNAKYALIGLKDYTVKVKDKSENKFNAYQFFEEAIADGGGFRVGGENQPQAAPQVAENLAGGVGGVDPFARLRANMRDNPAAVNQAPPMDVAHDFRILHRYPLRKCWIDGDETVGHILGVLDGHGRFWKSNGVRINRAMVSPEQHDIGLIYVKGIGASFWNECTVEWRPEDRIAPRPARNAAGRIERNGVR